MKGKLVCKGQTASGLPCQKPPLVGGEYCVYHDDRIGPDERCTAMTSAGLPCRKLPMPGLTVCEFHAGKTPISVRVAKQRLASMVPRALEALEQAMEFGDWPVVVRAAQIILDRAGLGAKATISIEEREKDLSKLTPDELEARARRVYAALREAQLAARQDLSYEPTQPTNPLLLEAGQGDEGSVS